MWRPAFAAETLVLYDFCLPPYRFIPHIFHILKLEGLTLVMNIAKKAKWLAAKPWHVRRESADMDGTVARMAFNKYGGNSTALLHASSIANGRKSNFGKLIDVRFSVRPSLPVVVWSIDSSDVGPCRVLV